MFNGAMSNRTHHVWFRELDIDSYLTYIYNKL
jgi:hypothetical protein